MSSSEQDKPFGRIAKDCREANIPFPQNLVDQFARVANKLNETWGRPLSADYLQDLIFPSRPGRRGFPPEVAEEILALKNLHEERYSSLLKTVWDPFEQMYRDKSEPEEYTTISTNTTAGRSFYGARKTTASASTPTRYSRAIAQLMPKSVRNQLEQLNAPRSAAAPTVSVPAPETEQDELLLDAERLIGETHMKAGTALLERLSALYPDHSPYPYLRMMEIFYQSNQREDFEWVAQRFSDRFKCEKLDWNPSSDAFRVSLDRLAETFLLAVQ